MTDTTFELPPPEESEARAPEVVLYVTNLKREAEPLRAQYYSQVDWCLNAYNNQWVTRNSDSEQSSEEMAINRAENAVLTQVAAMTADKPRIEFGPAESGDKSIWYLDVDREIDLEKQVPVPTGVVDAMGQPLTMPITAANVLAQINPAAWKETSQPDGTIAPPQPLTIEEVGRIRNAISMQILPENVLVEVNDLTKANWLQTVFDRFWEDANGDFYWSENALFCNALGFQPMLYEFDDATGQPRLSNQPYMQFLIAPESTDVSNADYVIYEQPLSAEKAIATYPELREAILKHKKTGQISGATDSIAPMAEVYRTTTFYREMVTITTAWLRYQAYPKTEAEAIRDGDVEQVMIELAAEPMPTAEPLPTAPAETEIDAGAMPAMEPAAMAPPAPTMLPVLVRADNGEVTEPGAENWTFVRYGIRQIKIVANELVEDRECPSGDIPVGWNVNKPDLFRPYGVGEPWRIKGIQALINDMAGGMRQHWRRHRYPTEVLPDSVDKALPEFSRGRWNDPAGARYKVPDSLFEKLQGKLVAYQDPPALSADVWRMFQLFLQLGDEGTNKNELLGGKASSNWSARAMDLMLVQAKSTILWRSLRAEMMLKHIAKLFAHDIATKVTPRKAAQISSKLPAHIVGAIQGGLKEFRYDTTVELVSGSGQKRQAQRMEAMAAAKTGLMSPDTAQIRMDLDPEKEMNNKINRAKKEREAMQSLAVAAPAVGPMPAMTQPVPGSTPTASPGLEPEQLTPGQPEETA